MVSDGSAGAYISSHSRFKAGERGLDRSPSQGSHTIHSHPHNSESQTWDLNGLENKEILSDLSINNKFYNLANGS